jgi:hypothetical protein
MQRRKPKSESSYFAGIFFLETDALVENNLVV